MDDATRRRITAALAAVLEPLHQIATALEEEIAEQRGEEPEDADWRSFVAEHPELTTDPPLTDEEVLAAVEPAIESHPEHSVRDGAAWASEVARIIYGELGDPVSEHHSRRVGRVAQRLSRLTRDGLVVRLRHKWGGHACMWSLPGIELGGYVKRYYVAA